MITDYLKEHKKLFMSGLTALCVAMMIVSATVEHGAGFLREAAGFVFVPVMGAFSNTGEWIADRVGAVMGAAYLISENSRLSAENEELLLQNSRLEFMAERNREIEVLLGVSESLFDEYPVLMADIVSRNPGTWHGTPIISAGTRDGVLRDMPVVTNGLFGRVIAVHNNHAEIRTILEDTSSIAAVGERTGDQGFVRGDHNLMLQGLVRLDFETQNAEFEPGDLIRTSALSSFFPPWLPIGEITEIRQLPNGDNYAIIMPIADFQNTRTVLILMDLFEFVLE